MVLRRWIFRAALLLIEIYNRILIRGWCKRYEAVINRVETLAGVGRFIIQSRVLAISPILEPFASLSRRIKKILHRWKFMFSNFIYDGIEILCHIDISFAQAVWCCPWKWIMCRCKSIESRVNHSFTNPVYYRKYFQFSLTLIRDSCDVLIKLERNIRNV